MLTMLYTAYQSALANRAVIRYLLQEQNSPQDPLGIHQSPFPRRQGPYQHIASNASEYDHDRDHETHDHIGRLV